MIYKIFFILIFCLQSLTANATCKSDVVDLNKLDDYSYVIVPGIFNEFISFYMTEYKNFLLNNGVPRDQILRVNSSSFEDPKKESSKLVDILNNFETDKPLVFFTHSKGGLETLYALKDFDLSRVHHVYFIQAPFDGASSHEIFYSPVFVDEFQVMQIVKKLAKWAFLSNRYSNFSREVVRAHVAASIKKRNLLDKLSFIMSETDYENLPLKLRLMGGLYQDHYDEPGDGVLLKIDQLPMNLDQSQTCVLDIEGSHDKFVKAAPWERERVNRIHSFIKYLLTDQKTPVSL